MYEDFPSSTGESVQSSVICSLERHFSNLCHCSAEHISSSTSDKRSRFSVSMIKGYHFALHHVFAQKGINFFKCREVLQEVFLFLRSILRGGISEPESSIQNSLCPLTSIWHLRLASFLLFHQWRELVSCVVSHLMFVN